MTQNMPGDVAAPTTVGREGLVAAITTFLAGRDPETSADIRAALERELDLAGPAAVEELDRRLATSGADWTYYPRDPLARRIHRVLADRFLEPGSALAGAEHVHAVAGRPVVVVSNHLSYSDANLFEVLLDRAGESAFSDRLTVIAGPKVYSSLKRRFSSLCFGTIKTPQSSALSSEDAVMNTRDVARAARRSIEAAHDRLRQGDALLVFGEGTRSRTGAMQPLLAGVTRYFDVPGVCVLPVSITGTEALYPIGEDALHPVQVVATVGTPIEVEALRAQAAGDRREMLDAIGRAIASQLPPHYRGVYAA